MYEHRVEASSLKNLCHVKAISIIYSECASVALLTQHEKRMRHIILPSVARLVLPHYFTLSHERQEDFGTKTIEHEMCDLILFTDAFEIFPIVRRTQIYTVFM